MAMVKLEARTDRQGPTMMKEAIILPRDAAPERREALRRIAVKGMRNLRDLGGYYSSDGRTLRWGLLYRSDALRPADARARAVIERMELATVVDFRSAEEREKKPDLIPEGQSLRLVHIPVFDGPNSVEHVVRGHLRAGTMAEVDPGRLSREAYGQFPRDFLPQFGTFIREILDAGGKPLLFHCAAGKDRTGFAAAILLRLLDVPAPTVLEDYMLSRKYGMKFKAPMVLAFRLRYGEEAYRVMKHFVGIEPGFLEASFAAIDELHGSFGNFARQGLGLGESDISRLKNTLLTDSAPG
jgi:protein-tyrosine phosphatase